MVRHGYLTKGFVVRTRWAVHVLFISLYIPLPTNMPFFLNDSTSYNNAKAFFSKY